MLFQLRNCFHLIKLTQVKTSFVALNLQYRIANVKEVVTITKEVSTITREVVTITWRSPTSH